MEFFLLFSELVEPKIQLHCQSWLTTYFGELLTYKQIFELVTNNRRKKGHSQYYVLIPYAQFHVSGLLNS